ncbi:hypothetical protein Scep_020912 [Stephania cephalantha]|uniref:CASP-like protein n=1 Tax=Stephania cephalantha TaxID=152367 RepID=A0AAP0HWD3_9MAGN
MEISQSKSDQNFPYTSRLLFFAFQILCRILGIAFTLASFVLMVKNKQTMQVFGITFMATYKYSTAFRFFVAVDAVACLLGLLALIFVFLPVQGTVKFIFQFILDLMVTLGMVAGCSAAVAYGWIGKYGNTYTAWAAICNSFGAFCDGAQISIGMAAAGSLLFLISMLYSVINSRKISEDKVRDERQIGNADIEARGVE